eukprot:7321208-Karenia_brevis.AAC.1
MEGIPVLTFWDVVVDVIDPVEPKKSKCKRGSHVYRHLFCAQVCGLRSALTADVECQSSSYD